MARNRGKKALYEVMSRARSKPGYGKTLEQMASKRVVENEPVAKPKSEAAAPKAATKWWKKPRVVQLNAGRVEFSIPYQVAVAVALVLVLVVVASYRLGQFSATGRQQSPALSGGQGPQAQNGPPARPAANDVSRPPATVERTSPRTEKAEPVKPAGNNVIVLVEYSAMADLKPVQAHFLENGIETEIVGQSGRYFLQTKQRYESTTTPGSDGYKAIQKIKEVGAKYKGKAPPGYETFAPRYFSDAYGKKVE
jgi:hypothetical protein